MADIDQEPETLLDKLNPVRLVLAVGLGLPLIFLDLLNESLEVVLVAVVVSIIISFAAEGVVDSLGRRGLNRKLATASAIFIVIALVVMLSVLLVPQVSSDYDSLRVELPKGLEKAEVWLSNNAQIDVDTTSAVERVESLPMSNEIGRRVVANTLTDSFGARLAFSAILISVFLSYLVADAPKLRSFLSSIMPPARQHEMLRAWELGIRATNRYVVSRIVVASACSLIAVVGLLLSRGTAPWLLGIIAGVSISLIPAVGTYVATAPILLVMLLDSRPNGFVVLAVVAIALASRALASYRRAGTGDLHPAVAFGALVTGAGLFGPIFAFLLIPLVVIANQFIGVYVARHHVIESRLTEHTAPG